MKTLLVEDDFTSRVIMQELLTRHGATVHVAVDGNEAVKAFEAAWDASEPYHLVCLDIMMPGLDGHGVLKRIREYETARGVTGGAVAKVFMASALSDGKNVFQAFREQCEAYLVKPIDPAQLRSNLVKVGLIPA
jgi:two-component system, chemotaxis family, chemotaxis protein CheY